MPKKRKHAYANPLRRYRDADTLGFVSDILELFTKMSLVQRRDMSPQLKEADCCFQRVLIRCVTHLPAKECCNLKLVDEGIRESLAHFENNEVHRGWELRFHDYSRDLRNLARLLRNDAYFGEPRARRRRKKAKGPGPERALTKKQRDFCDLLARSGYKVDAVAKHLEICSSSAYGMLERVKRCYTANGWPIPDEWPGGKTSAPRSRNLTLPADDLLRGKKTVTLRA